MNTDKLREKKYFLFFFKMSFLDQVKVILCNIKSSSISHEMVRRKGEIFNFALIANSTGYPSGLLFCYFLNLVLTWNCLHFLHRGEWQPLHIQNVLALNTPAFGELDG